MMTSNYDKFPHLEVRDGEGQCALGWDAVLQRLELALADDSGDELSHHKMMWPLHCD